MRFSCLGLFVFLDIVYVCIVIVLTFEVVVLYCLTALAMVWTSLDCVGCFALVCLLVFCLVVVVVVCLVVAVCIDCFDCGLGLMIAESLLVMFVFSLIVCFYNLCLG